MKRCYYCDDLITGFGHKCRYCSNQFCDDHRLPEYHECHGEYRKVYSIDSDTQTNNDVNREDLIKKIIKLDEKIEKGGNIFQVLLEKAKTLSLLNKPGQVIKICNKILEYWPDNGEILILRGDGHLKLRNRVEALEYINWLLKLIQKTKILLENLKNIIKNCILEEKIFGIEINIHSVI